VQSAQSSPANILSASSSPLNCHQSQFDATWANQLDLGIARNFEVGGLRLRPQLDVFNVFNANRSSAPWEPSGRPCSRRGKSWALGWPK
jgi:hypothetical protein